MAIDQRIHLKNYVHPERSALTLARQMFMISREASGCTQPTLDWYQDYLGNGLAWLEQQGIEQPQDVSPTHIRSLYIHLQKRGLADQTIHNYARALRAFFKFLSQEEMLSKNPMDKVKMPRLPKRILPALEVEDVRKLISVCDTTRDKAMVLALIDTGCRAAEFVALNIGDVDLSNGTVMVRQGKGRKDRVTFLGAKARKAVVKYLMERGSAHSDMPLWVSMRTGERLTDWGLRLMLKRLGKRASVEHCHPHTFRRTCALWSLRAGMNIYALQQIMGHSDLTMLRRYLALVEHDLETAHQRHGAVDSLL